MTTHELARKLLEGPDVRLANNGDADAESYGKDITEGVHYAEYRVGHQVSGVWTWTHEPIAVIRQ